MRRALRVVAVIDRVSEFAGLVASWLALAMVLIGALNALARFAGRFVGRSLGSNACIELQWYLFSLVFLLGASYALRRDVHVRVDVCYGRLGERGRALIDVAGSILLLAPFSSVVIWLSFPSVLSSWRVFEGSPDPGGLPRYPIKSMILVGFALLLLQGGAQAVKGLSVLLRTDRDAARGERA